MYSPPCDCWPRLMRASVAAKYLGEANVAAFRRSVGTLYPLPVRVKGKGERWLRDALDEAIDRLTGRTNRGAEPKSAADLL